MIIDPSDAPSTALLCLDLQVVTMGLPTRPATTSEVLQRTTALATRLRGAGGCVIVVRSDFSADFADALHSPADQPMALPPMPPNWAELAPGLAECADVVVTKRQWGAFYGTDLDLQLRRRGLKTLILTGIATNFAVESTARAAWEHGYDVVIAEDAVSGLDDDDHHFALTRILPRLGRVRSTASLLSSFHKDGTI